MSADWSNTIDVNVIYSPSPPGRQGFSNVLLLVDQDDGNSLNGQRVTSYGNVIEAQQANAAGYLSSAVLAAATAAFSQVPAPARIKIGYRDTGANETLAAALLAIEAIDSDWYVVTQDSREDADIVALSTAIEARQKLYIAQSDDASLLDAALPAGLTALTGKERTALLYHNNNDSPADVAWGVSRSVFDPDNTSAPWEGEVRGVLGYSLTTAQRDAAEANKINLGLPYSSAAFFVDPGVNMKGRALYEIVTGDWLRARLREDIAYLRLQHTARGEKLIVNASGQAKILGILNRWLLVGERVGHFNEGNSRARPEPITSSDELARRLRFRVEAQIAGSARSFLVNVYLQPEPLAATA